MLLSCVLILLPEPAEQVDQFLMFGPIEQDTSQKDKNCRLLQNGPFRKSGNACISRLIILVLWIFWKMSLQMDYK